MDPQQYTCVRDQTRAPFAICLTGCKSLATFRLPMIAPRYSRRVRAIVLAASTGLLLTTASSVAVRGTQAPPVPAPGRPAPPAGAASGSDLERAAAAARQGRQERQERQEEVRALWVTRSSLVSAEQISRLARDARDAGFNTLLVQVRGRGDAWFTQGLEPRPEALANSSADFDPLAMTLTHAHAAGLRVHAWINVNLISSAVVLPRDRNHIVHAHPEWLMVPRALG